MAISPEILLRGPLQDDARKHRRNLLAVTAITIAIVDLQLIPRKLPILDVDVTSLEQTTLPFLLNVALGYFVIAFLVYAVPDHFAWRTTIRWSKHEMAEKVIERVRSQPPQQIPDYWKAAWGKRSTRIWIFMLSDVKAIFDLALPFPFAIYAFVRLAGWPFSNLWALAFGLLFVLPIVIYLVVRLVRVARRSFD